MKRKIRIIELASCALLFIIMLILELTNATSIVNNRIEDSLYQDASYADISSIRVIGIDAITIKEYGGKYDQFVREKTADLINKLCKNPDKAPAVIAVDIGFYGESTSSPTVDEKLVDAVRNAGNVVLVSSQTFMDEIIEYSDGSFSVVTKAVSEEPFEALKNACAGIGHSNTDLDDDGVARHSYSTITIGDKTIKSFDEVVYNLYTGKESGFANNFYIKYSGKPTDFYGDEGYGSSMYNVLDKWNDAQVANEFKGKVVYIGAYASGMQDAYATPVSSSYMNGVEIHANILQQMLENKVVTETSKVVDIIILVVILVISIGIIFIPFKFSFIGNILVGIIYFILALILGKNNVNLPVFNPLLLAFLLSVVIIFIKYFGAFMEKRRLVSNYGKYLSPEIAATISEDSEKEIKLGGVKRDVAVLFVDIRGFTTLSEKLTPDRVVEMLNCYLAVTTSSIFNNKGTVDKFIGDATMGVFNAPLELDDYTYRCVCAGIEMASRTDEVDEKLPEDLKGKVGFGIGINCGEAVIGNIGADFRMEYTAIGDTVNTASRLEGQAKRGTVVISEAVYERVKDRILCEDLGFVKLKGKEHEVKIYRAIKKMEVNDNEKE